MEKQLTPLLEKLASQLGTTAQFLWSVTVRQARIDSTINIILYVILIMFGILWWFISKKIHSFVSVGYEQKVADGDRGYYKKHVMWDDAWYVFIGVGWVILFVFFILMVISMPGTITGFYNPEYWAFKHIMSLITGARCNG